VPTRRAKKTAIYELGISAERQKQIDGQLPIKPRALTLEKAIEISNARS
jgi:hypothetical protein